MEKTGVVIRDCARRLIEILDDIGDDVLSRDKDIHAVMDDLLALEGLDTIVASPTWTPPSSAVSTGWLYYDCDLRIVRGGLPVNFAQRPHNHGSWNIFGVYRGALHYRSYRRLDDGSVMYHADLEVAEDRIMRDGDVTILPAPPHDIHATTGLAVRTVSVLVARGPFDAVREQYLPELHSYYHEDAEAAAR